MDRRGNEERRKIFGLGLSKTGTTSLGDALQALGIPTIHYPHDPATYGELTRGHYRLSILRTYQAIVDISVAPFYAQLDRQYPGSRFILTVRDRESWLKSIEAHWSFMGEWADRDPQFRRFTEFISACVYGCLDFHRERFAFAYETHLKNVRDYFRHRRNDLLELDICGGEGWSKLCPFLGLPEPPAPFPHRNKHEERRRDREWVRRFDAARAELERTVPVNGRFILVDDAQLGPGFGSGRHALPFLERDGLYWGRPADNQTAIRELQRLRGGGAEHLVVAWPSFWWFDYYEGFREYVTAHFPRLLQTDHLMVFDLRK